MRTLTQIAAALQPGQSIEIVRHHRDPAVVSVYIEQHGPLDRRGVRFRFHHKQLELAVLDIVGITLDKRAAEMGIG